MATKNNTETLDIVEAKTKDLTKADLEKVIEQKNLALNLAESTIDKQRKEIKEQVDRYNTDFEKMFELNQNLMSYSDNKNKATLKVLEGLSELIKLDIKEDKGESNGN